MRVCLPIGKGVLRGKEGLLGCEKGVSGLKICVGKGNYAVDIWLVGLYFWGFGGQVEVMIPMDGIESRLEVLFLRLPLALHASTHMP